MEGNFSQLEPTDAIRLRAAVGWMELGDFVSANDELDEISPKMRVNPCVLFVRCQICIKAEKWDMAAELSDTLTKLLPDNAEIWVNLAYATRRKTGGGIPQAREILLAAEPKFPREYIFPYNLACYCSQMREFPDAERWLKKAMAIKPDKVKQMAIEDEDFKPLWDSMGGTMWKAE